MAFGFRLTGGGCIAQQPRALGDGGEIGERFSCSSGWRVLGFSTFVFSTVRSSPGGLNSVRASELRIFICMYRGILFLLIMSIFEY